MAEVSFPSSQVHFEKSSLVSSTQVETESPSKISRTHFEESSLAPSIQVEMEKPSKPQLSPSFSPNKSYQILVIEHAKNLDALQGTLLKFDTEQIEKVAEKTKVVFSKLLEETGYAREREINAKKWQTVAVVMGSGMMIASFFTPLPPIAALSTFVVALQANFTAQQLVNKGYLLNTKAKITCLDHELQKGKHEQSRLAQNSGTNVFSEIENQIHLLAMALDKQIINF